MLARMPADPADPTALLADRHRRDPASPLLTYYDDASGERTEVSVTTFANWVAKTANLLGDEVGLGEHATVGVMLPLHWQSAVIVMAAWSHGAQVRLFADATEAASAAEVELLVVDEPGLDEVADVDAGLVLALALRPMNQPLTRPRPGVVDYAAEVLAQGDRFSPYAPVDPDAVAARTVGAAWTGRDLVRSADAMPLSAGDRVLSVLPLSTVDGLLAGLLGPLAAGCGAVLCANADPAGLAHRADTEQVTIAAGLTLPDRRGLTAD